MTSVKRLALFLTAILMAGHAHAATVIKIATLVPQNTAWGSKIDAGRKEIAARTDERVKLKIYYGGVQGHAGKVKQRIRFGQLHGGDFTPTDFQDSMPDLNIYGLPFVFQSNEEVAYVRSRMDETLSAGFEEQGLVTFGFAGEFAIVLSNEPVRSLEDLRGKQIWLPEGDSISDRAMKRLQLVPNSKPISDVITGLRTGLFDVVAAPPAAAVALQWHTSVKYFTDMPVLYAMSFMAIDKRVFNKLSAGDQAIVSEVLRRVYKEINDNGPLDAANAKDALANSGIQSVQPADGELEKIRRVMADNNRDMARQGLFSLQLLEQMQGHIADFRNGSMNAGDVVVGDAAESVANGNR
ncbi:MAG: TRAP transporter substrate-binding protein DctP [Gammaproteobacteria bacterium]|nr:TRAP transporter substrate-binding protein DctP [Gammaproteobacteria bacterium]